MKIYPSLSERCYPETCRRSLNKYILAGGMSQIRLNRILSGKRPLFIEHLSKGNDSPVVRKLA